ncbi:sigma-70 family RNA polymerase sigma factor [Peribacillus muralis]|uniref:sigma-70 family RNA polymerase sigma factor n=1 Tax=Peribacillus muralis TaxID=264697 RepID=UPI001F4DF4FE|nr:sigma-70 family RNA polymerase sigma factor [Peribacillus muralis]MCK1993285.1 sigma-70 family RNA polymerase sigma factor [Peribacillus muralis]MCK2013839.1 sigma-70 family RNA polymerase sigma factor [Peribacillus muralis]
MINKLRENNSQGKDNRMMLREVYPELLRFCRFLTQSDWDGDDLAQDTIIKAMLGYGSETELTTALLKTIARHSWIDTIRKRKKESLEDLGDTEHQAGFGENAFETVEYIIKSLTPKQAVVFLLKEGFLYRSKEISNYLNTTESAVKAILNRVKKRFDSRVAERKLSGVEDWHYEEEQRLMSLMTEALKTQNPDLLIKSIPSFKSLNSESLIPKLMNTSVKPCFTPSNTLSMAA